MELKKVNDYITYLKHTEDPLSSDIVIINDKGNLFLYDVGNNIEANDYLKDKYNVVISHFHLDHMGNLNNISINDLYVSNETHKHCKKGIIVDKDLYIGNIHLFNIPSSHSKGALGLEINEYAFFGDSLYGKYINNVHTHNVQLLNEEITLLTNLNAKYILESHDMIVQNKKDVINRLNNIYANREKNNPIIIVEDK